jgi:endonuclease YncB( thermonuclease family)
MLQELATACHHLNRHASAVRYIDESLHFAKDLEKDKKLITKLEKLRDDYAKELAKITAAAAPTAQQQRP